MEIATKCICCNSSSMKKHKAFLAPFMAYKALGYHPSNSVIMSYVRAMWGKSLKCRECGVMFSDMRFNDEEMAKYYCNYMGDDYSELREHYEPFFKACRHKHATRLRPNLSDEEIFISRYISPKRILDYGGGKGVNTPFSSTDAIIHIYDIGDKNCELLPDFGYDLIKCCYVLEHVSYPQDILNNIKKLMNENTFLYVEVPHERIPYFLKWWWHEHINFFTPKGMENLIRNCGMTLVDSITSPYYGFLVKR